MNYKTDDQQTPNNAECCVPTPINSAFPFHSDEHHLKDHKYFNSLNQLLYYIDVQMNTG